VTHYELLGVTFVQMDDSKKSYKKYKTQSMIEVETGRKMDDIYDEEISNGLTHVEIARKYSLRGPSSLHVHARKADLKPVCEFKVATASIAERHFLAEVGVTLESFLRDKYLNEGLPTGDIGILLNCCDKSVQRLLKYYKIPTRSKSEIRQLAMKSGRLDWQKTLEKIHKGNRRRCILGSDIEIRYRFLLQEHLNNRLKNCEIIVGFNNYSILGKYEVDIPIIILGKYTHKFAIEVDGYAHKREISIERDILKNNILESKGWQVIRIILDNNEHDKIQYKVVEVVNKIIKQILESEK
jgi:very-short-patch-repair endonuclease